jgi:hypothetical protein
LVSEVAEAFSEAKAAASEAAAAAADAPMLAWIWVDVPVFLKKLDEAAMSLFLFNQHMCKPVA